MSSAGPDRIVLDDDDDDEHGRQYEVQMLVEQLKEERGQTDRQREREAPQRRGGRLMMMPGDDCTARGGCGSAVR